MLDSMQQFVPPILAVTFIVKLLATLGLKLLIPGPLELELLITGHHMVRFYRLPTTFYYSAR